MQVRICIESYIETNFTAVKADIWTETPHKASVAAQSYHSNLLRQSVNRKQNLILQSFS